MKKGLCLSSLLMLAVLSPSYATAGVQQGKASVVTSNYAKTKYPILFNHGMFGFSRLGTASFGADYFYQVLPDLARNGATVYASQVSPLESTELRGEQLLAQVDEVLALTGSTKLNLIGHSHGGPTIRYIEIVAPEKVASLTAVAGSFKGTKVADDLLSNTATKLLLTILGEYIVAPLITILEANPTLPNNIDHSLKSISLTGSADFNARFPSAAIPADCGNGQKITNNGVYHYSWAGKAQLTNLLDPIDSTISQLAPLSYKNNDNDGLVGQCSTHLGQVIRDDYNLTHLDLVNLIFGLKGFFAPDPVALYRQQANRLKLEGL